MKNRSDEQVGQLLIEIDERMNKRVEEELEWHSAKFPLATYKCKKCGVESVYPPTKKCKRCLNCRKPYAACSEI